MVAAPRSAHGAKPPSPLGIIPKSSPKCYSPEAPLTRLAVTGQGFTQIVKAPPALRLTPRKALSSPSCAHFSGGKRPAGGCFGRFSAGFPCHFLPRLGPPRSHPASATADAFPAVRPLEWPAAAPAIA